MRKFLLLLSFVILIVSLAEITQAAKVLPQATKIGKPAVQTVSSGITVTPRLRTDRNALLVNFGNLQKTTSVSYTLVYNANGQEEGAGGTISSSDNTTTRELLFGTCSGNVCRYHENITNMRFEVTSTLKSGKKTLKRYRIKV